MKHNYNEPKQNRIDHAKDQARKNIKKAEAHRKTADHIAHVTQGEPVKRGHHSERRHLRDLDRLDGAMRGSIEAEEKASYYTEKAVSIASNQTISSDDPDAIAKLQAQLDDLVRKQEFMKAANKCIRAGDLEGFLLLPSATTALWDLLTAESLGRWKGYEGFELSNNNSNINRITKRIAQLKKDETRKTTRSVVKGVTIVLNAEANRVQLIFPAKPSAAVRNTLKRTYNFNWAESENAWQRHYNHAGVYAAQQFMAGYTPEE